MDSGMISVEKLEAVAEKNFCDFTGITKPVRLTGGASYETWAFALKNNTGSNIPLILRRMPPGAVRLSYSTEPEVEADLFCLASDSGVPAPQIHYVLDPENDKLGRGFIAECVSGETLGGKIVHGSKFSKIRPQLARQCGEILARIHRMKAQNLSTMTVIDQIEDLHCDYLELDCRSPIFELAFRWLRNNATTTQNEPKLVHGDFRNGNLIIGNDGIRAVLDWELTHLGDPAEDLGWLTVNSWRFGEINLPVGGFGSLEDLLEGYVAGGGEDISVDRILYWRAFGTLRWGIMCGKMAMECGSAAGSRLERVIIGRRMSEAEIDLLPLLFDEVL